MATLLNGFCGDSRCIQVPPTNPVILIVGNPPRMHLASLFTLFQMNKLLISDTDASANHDTLLLMMLLLLLVLLLLQLQ